jgi:1-aminocyclopropane-1-carboxylate deaminase/D-cysteine desulfhydrase-like pyridoxal-dependent ACC family enzyme
MPGWRLVWNNCSGCRVNRRDGIAQWLTKTQSSDLQQEIAQLLEVKASAEITLWDDYFAP